MVVFFSPHCDTLLLLWYVAFLASFSLIVLLSAVSLFFFHKLLVFFLWLSSFMCQISYILLFFSSLIAWLFTYHANPYIPLHQLPSLPVMVIAACQASSPPLRWFSHGLSSPFLPFVRQILCFILVPLSSRLRMFSSMFSSSFSFFLCISCYIHFLYIFIMHLWFILFWRLVPLLWRLVISSLPF